MTSKQWLRYLSPEERKRFFKNVVAYSVEYDEVYDWSLDYGSFYSFISDGFAWAETPEGENYWAYIANSLRTTVYKGHFCNIHVKIASTIVEKDIYFPDLMKIHNEDT